MAYQAKTYAAGSNFGPGDATDISAALAAAIAAIPTPFNDTALKQADTDERTARQNADIALGQRIDAKAEAAATTTALAGKADLDGNGKVPSLQIPASSTFERVPVASQAAMLALTSAQVQYGDVAIRTDFTPARRYQLVGTGNPATLANWELLSVDPNAAVDSINGQTGAVNLGAADVGAATAAQGNKADTAVQPGALGSAAYKATGDFDAAGAASAAVAAAAAASGSRVLDRVFPTPLTASGPITNTTAESTMFTLNLSSANFKALDIIKFDINWDVFNNSGASQAITYRWYVNGTVLGSQVLTYTAAANSTQRSRHVLDIDLMMAALNDERWSFSLIGTQNSNSGATVDSLTANKGAGGAFATTVDMSGANNTFSMTATFANAVSTADVRLLAAAATRFR